MVLLEKIDLEVCVFSKGKPAPEYDGPPPLGATHHEAKPKDASKGNDAGDTRADYETIYINKYIEVTEDDEFSIRILPTALNGKFWDVYEDGITCRPYVDGHKGTGYIMSSPFEIMNIKGVEDIEEGASYGTLRRYCFQALTTTEDATKDRIKDDIDAARGLGIIRIVIWRTQAGDVLAGHATKASSSFERFEELHEKALKGRALSHGTGFTEAEQIAKPNCIKTRKVDRSPIAIVNFYYRSRKALHEEFIIPRSPSPEIEARVKDLSIDQLRQLVEKQRAQLSGKTVKNGQKDQAVATKRAADGDIPLERPRNMSKSPSVIQPDTAFQVIDLTRDSADEDSDGTAV